MDADRAAPPHPQEGSTGAEAQRALVEQLAERVYRLMRAELRLDHARGGASLTRPTRE